MKVRILQNVLTGILELPDILTPLGTKPAKTVSKGFYELIRKTVDNGKYFSKIMKNILTLPVGQV